MCSNARVIALSKIMGAAWAIVAGVADMAPRMSPVLAVSLLWAAASAWAAEPAARNQPLVNLQSLLEEMLNFEAVARSPEPAFTCKQADSQDRRRKGPDKPDRFAKSDTQFMRVDEAAGRKQYVLLDAEGPGAIVRFFVTSDAGKPGKMRIYLDGSPTPLLESQAFDLMQCVFNPGSPLVTTQPGYVINRFGGSVSYVPIPYARSCRVTWEEPDGGPVKPCIVYQINYRTYAAEARVETVTAESLALAAGEARRVNRILAAPPVFAGGTMQTLEKTLGPEQSASIDLPAGPTAVRDLAVCLRVQDTNQLARAFRSTIISAEFDGQQTVWCPLGDFFGAGPGLSVVHTWYRNVMADGQMDCKWVMPYSKSGRITFHNLADKPLTLQSEAVTDRWKWDSRSMYFHANWHCERQIQSPPYLEWNFINIKGKGIYVGDTLAIFNPLPSWYGEGTERIWVDGDTLPSHMGTGTEDYYNFSWAPKPTFAGPFTSHVRMDEAATQGHNVLTRTRNLDGIPFQHSFQMNMDIMPWKSSRLDYAATTYWYAFPEAASNVKPQPSEAALPVPTLAEAKAKADAPVPSKPGAIECETMKVVRKSGDFPVWAQDMGPWGRERWSGGRQLVAQARKSGDFIELEVPAPDVRPKQVWLHATHAPDFGMVSFRINGEACGPAFDGYVDQLSNPSEPLKLGVFTPKDGRFLLHAELTGANQKSKGHYFALDYVVLEEVR